ncbi:hypothetical protein J6590_019761 [Homalodisca vitripennis]|nr:hypothetical protein J6590_019761 [Homalodisca vitripennis]
MCGFTVTEPGPHRHSADSRVGHDACGSPLGTPRPLCSAPPPRVVPRVFTSVLVPVLCSRPR